MENKHLIIFGTVVLVVVLGILAVSQSYNSPEVGGGFDFLDLNNRPGNSQTQPTPSPMPQITELSGQELQVGTGSAVLVGDSVTVHYVGMFLDGKKFDSSYDRNQPFTVQTGVGAVIPGFDQGVIGMKVGGKRRLIIPANLAYGEKGQGSIPPNTPLVFEVELLAITPKPVSPTPEEPISEIPQESPTSTSTPQP